MKNMNKFLLKTFCLIIFYILTIVSSSGQIVINEDFESFGPNIGPIPHYPSYAIGQCWLINPPTPDWHVSHGAPYLKTLYCKDDNGFIQSSNSGIAMWHRDKNDNDGHEGGKGVFTNQHTFEGGKTYSVCLEYVSNSIGELNILLVNGMPATFPPVHHSCGEPVPSYPGQNLIHWIDLSVAPANGPYVPYITKTYTVNFTFTLAPDEQFENLWFYPHVDKGGNVDFVADITLLDLIVEEIAGTNSPICAYDADCSEEIVNCDRMIENPYQFTKSGDLGRNGINVKQSTKHNFIDDNWCPDTEYCFSGLLSGSIIEWYDQSGALIHSGPCFIPFTLGTYYIKITNVDPCVKTVNITLKLEGDCCDPHINNTYILTAKQGNRSGLGGIIQTGPFSYQENNCRELCITGYLPGSYVLWFDNFGTQLHNGDCFQPPANGIYKVQIITETPCTIEEIWLTIEVTGCSNNKRSPNNISQKSLTNALYPNPFSSSSNLEFTLSQATDVRISVYDKLGRLIQQPVNKFKDAGNHNIEIDGSDWANGMYIVHLEYGDQVETFKLIKH